MKEMVSRRWAVRRGKFTPGTPTLVEQGFKDLTFTEWFGFFVPARTPSQVVTRLNAEVLRVTRLPETKERLSALGFALIGSTPQEFTDYIRANIARIGPVVKAAGIKPE